MINLTYKKVKSSSHSITLINVSDFEQDDEIRFLGLW
uniref:Uncharacterized protein n=1 Tax=Brassica oleracea TaxID=3712 RepID=A0A3P6GAY5_BRAOL|nr:unnamed protein product [Brassica oleracea]